MYTLFEIPDKAKEMLARSRVLLPQIFSRVMPLRKSVRLSATSDLYGAEERRGRLYLLTEGAVSFWLNDENIFTYEEGDLVGLEQDFNGARGRYVCEFAVVADEFELSDIVAAAAVAEVGTWWTEFLIDRLNAETLIVAAVAHGEREFRPRVRNYSAGTVIIEQGAVANEVYTLLQGRADVFVDGVKVGEVLQDEIFGALATLTDMPRTATVKAASDSLAMSLEKEKFMDLMQKRPHTVLKMVEDMARSIVALNQQVVNKIASQKPSGAEKL